MAANFDYSVDFRTTDFRACPDLYRVGKGEQGVLLVQPYKSEILPHWRFKNPEVAYNSANKIYAMFLDYLAKHDFVGADMARKFLQMGYTRSRRYANHRSGRKYSSNPQHEASPEAERQMRKDAPLPVDPDPVKAASAEVFRQKWMAAKEHPEYRKQMERHQELFEKGAPKNGMPSLEFFSQRRQLIKTVD
jgi:hypothetical protein